MSSLNKLDIHLKNVSIHEWSASRIRETFINFFVSKCRHEFYPSCPVVPHDDPTLLFTNAGMNQYKPVFLGQIDPSHPMYKLKRACNSQKCIRAGGKHNDLDDVGKDVYHHTFFEMLGNWSFGDYFKIQTIGYAWELLVNVYKLDKQRIYATYFGGDEKLNLAPDNETKELWLKYLPINRILPFGCKDNFWEMGDVGPCGPCTEIHYDRIGNRDASKFVNADSPDVIEIWNLVFIQYNRIQDGSLVSLPEKHVDTGMGFERLASILQNKNSNYDTDIFTPIFKEIEKITNAEQYTGLLGKEDLKKKDMAYRVIADHIRTLTFAIADGAVPSNEGRGYVLRRILRRAVRFGEQFLNAPSGFMSKLVMIVVDMMKDSFPELVGKQSFVEEIILDEEISFRRTLSKGIEKFKKLIEKIKQNGGNNNIIPGEEVFFLYDSMGFPLDLTQIMAEEEGFTVDIVGYEAKMKEQTERSKINRKNIGIDGSIIHKPLILEAKETSYLTKNNILPTIDEMKYQSFIAPVSKIVAIFSNHNEELNNDSIETGFLQKFDDSKVRVGVILDNTTFYSQGGGQIYDIGLLTTDNNQSEKVHFEVDAVESYGGYVVHMGFVRSGAITVGKSVYCQVDYKRRQKIAANHTMTHALNFALNKTLKESTDQKGSLVDAERLRFDFSSKKPVNVSQIKDIEQICQNLIKEKIRVHVMNTDISKALQIKGLRAVFGETYPDNVRVVSIGQKIENLLQNPENESWVDYSVELCGGTHLENTKDADHFILYEETAIAKGIRRIQACTGDLAKAAENNAEKLSKRIEDIKLISDNNQLVASVADLKQSVDTAVISLVKKNIFRKEVDLFIEKVKKIKKDEIALQTKNSIMETTKKAIEAGKNNIEFVIIKVETNSTDAKLGRDMIENMKKIYLNNSTNIHASFFIFNIDKTNNKTAGFCHVCDYHANKFGLKLDAREWLNYSLKEMNGRGGGKPTNASGQAKTLDGLDKAFDAAHQFIRNLNE